MKKSFQDQLSEFALSRGFDVRKEPNVEATKKLSSRNKLIEKGINKKLQSVIKLAHVGRNGEQFKVGKTVDISAFLKFIIECKQKGEISETDEYFCLCTVENIEDFPPNEILKFQQVFHNSSSRIRELFDLNKLSKKDNDSYLRQLDTSKIRQEKIRKQNAESYLRRLDVIKIQQENIRIQKKLDHYMSLAKKVLLSGIDIGAKISFTPVLDEDDFTLSMGWLDDKLKNEIKNRVNIVLEKFGEDYEVGRVLSARAAEKAAKIFYQRCGFQVEDVSINQIKQNKDDEWKYFDLKVNNYPVDIKNSRRAISSPERYVEHCVPKKGKITRNNKNVTIVGILSRYLWPKTLLEPEEYNDGDTTIIFLGETTYDDHGKLINEFKSDHFDIDFGRPDRDANYFLPPWIFNYPSILYKNRDCAIAELAEQGAMDYILCQKKDFNVIPLCIATNINLAKYWPDESLKKWEWEIYQKLLKNVRKYRLSLPFLFLTILNHFTEMLSSHSEQHEDYSLVFPRFSGHTEEFQLIKDKMEVCHGEKRGTQVF